MCFPSTPSTLSTIPFTLQDLGQTPVPLGSTASCLQSESVAGDPRYSTVSLSLFSESTLVKICPTLIPIDPKL